MKNINTIVKDDNKELISPSKFFVVVRTSDEDWEQLSIGLDTYNQAIDYINSEQTKNKYPYAFIVCTINKNL